MQIVFVDPPEKHPNPKPYGKSPAVHPWTLIADQLRANPGRWALCLRDVAISPSGIKHGRITAFRPAGHFQVRTVQTHNFDAKGRPLVDLYLKYDPTPKED